MALKPRLWLAGLLALSTACSSDPTQIMIAVDTDLSVPDQLDRVVIRMMSPEGREQTSEALLGPGQLPLPRILGVVHEEGPLGPYDTTVVGMRASNMVVSRRGLLTFEEGRIRLWSVELVSACRGVSCADGETCDGGDCRSIEVAEGDLLPWDNRMFPEDGGVNCVDELCNERDDDCDGTIDEGIDTQSDDRNCGRCGNDCTELPNATAVCMGGTCQITSCADGFGDCSSEPGCETDTTSDPNNCGTCGMQCRNPDNECCGSTCMRNCP